MSAFLNLPAGILAATIAVPALLLLYFLKLKRKEAAVSSTLLWRKAIQDLQVNAPFQKLRKNLLLFLQLLLLLLLCLALARPVARAAAGPGKMSVLLIDHSASMNATDVHGGSRLELAKRRAIQLVSSMPADAQAMVVAFDDSARVIQPFTSDSQALKNAIDSIQPTDRPTRFKTAFELAESQNSHAAKPTGPKPEVWLFSDGRASDRDEASLRSPLHYEKIGTNSADNVGIVAMNARRNYQDPTKVQIFVRLANFGNKPLNPDLELSVAPISSNPKAKLQWQVMRVSSTELLPDSWTPAQREKAEKEQGLKPRDSVEFELQLTSAAALKVQQMRKDALPADDSAQVIVPPPRLLRALLVTDGNYFLETALKSLNLQNPVVTTPLGYAKSWSDPKNNPSTYDLIIFDAFVPKRLPSAGNFIWFAAVPPGLGVAAEKKGTAFVQIPDRRFLDWRTDHPILRNLSLQNVLLQNTLKLSITGNAEVLAQGLRGPLIVLDRENQQTHLIVGFDLWQSDWPEHVSFPIFMRNAVQFMALGSQMNVRQSYTPGDTPRISRQQLAKLGDIKQFTLLGPDGPQTISVPAAGDLALPPLNRVGIYTLTPPVQQLSHLAVNLLDPTESNLTPANLTQTTGQQPITGASDYTRRDLWRWLISFIVLPLLLIEWWVYTRRVHM